MSGLAARPSAAAVSCSPAPRRQRRRRRLEEEGAAAACSSWDVAEQELQSVDSCIVRLLKLLGRVVLLQKQALCEREICQHELMCVCSPSRTDDTSRQQAVGATPIAAARSLTAGSAASVGVTSPSLPPPW